jgi:hypothetical protein
LVVSDFIDVVVVDDAVMVENKSLFDEVDEIDADFELPSNRLIGLKK